MLRDGCFQFQRDANIEIFEYIEIYYHHQRKHSSLHYKTPAQFEHDLNLHN